MPRIRKPSPRYRPGLALVAVLAGCAPRAAVPDRSTPAEPGALMVGAWDIWATTGGGPSLGITVDSALGDRYFARVTRAFAGDVGEDPAVFRPIEGTVSPDSTTQIVIMRRDASTPAWDLTVRPVGDSLVVTGYVWEGEDQMALGRRWLGRRRGRR